MRRAFAPLLLLAAALACRPQAPAPAAAPAAGEDGPLVTTLQVLAARGQVQVALAVTNASAAPVVLEFRSAQRYDFAVQDGERTLWRWSEGRGFAQAVGADTLPPGVTRSWSESWTPSPGHAGREFTAVGTLTAANLPREQRSAFRIP
ncbi:MAG TPA: BsuPI-related putative proteinase inhibitor [Longimicrobium sp.]|jgi:hypothetical protein